MTNQLENQIASYQRWREDIRSGIEAYQAWLDQHGHVDIQRSLRIYDLLESLRNDRMVLAFLAEYSRGKTELINAMFFADFKQRLLPSDVGRTTMCPTEVFYDPAEEPYIRLLPIETRKREDSIASLKQHPIEWVKIKLNLQSQEEMANAMASLAETKQVRVEEASDLGLIDQKDFVTTTVVTRGSKVEIPAWRHAMINYPHPLLKSGLVILDTPGLNALGTEPELTLKMIPSAHAILFLLAMDTGVTKSDMEIWQRYVQSYQTRRIAVLNKIDLLWDELKTEDQIEESIVRQVTSTCQLLELPPNHVITLSAQKALLARIRGDDVLLERSGIRELEDLLANEIVPAKQEILRSAVVKEMGAMVEGSLQSVMAQLTANQAELQELAKLSGKNRELAKTMLARLEKDRATYIEHMESFKTSYGVVLKQGHALMANLDEEHIDEIFARSSKDIEGSWTTAGLMRSMNSLFDAFSRQAEKILGFASETRGVRRQGLQGVPGALRLRQPDAAAAQPGEAHPGDEGAQGHHREVLPRSGQRHDREALPGAALLQRPGERSARPVPGHAQGARLLAQERAAADLHPAQGAPDAAGAAGGQSEEALRRSVQPAGAPASAGSAEDGARPPGRGAAADQVQSAGHRGPPAPAREGRLSSP